MGDGRRPYAARWAQPITGDAFEARRTAVLAEWGEDAAEDQDGVRAAENIWVTPEARWTHLKAQAKQSTA